MVIFVDRVGEQSTTTGTVDFNLGGPPAGYQSFASGFSIGSLVHYVAFAVDASGIPSGQWETGQGTLSAATTLERTIIYNNSSGTTSRINFTSASLRIYHDVPAHVYNSIVAGGEVATPNGSMLDRTKLGNVTVSDNFTSSSLYQWVIPTGAWPAYISNVPWPGGNFGDAAYSQPGDGTTGITFNDSTYGGLKLSLYQDAAHSNAWYCGLISSVDQNGNGFAATEGYWQITAKLPPPNATGAWFGFWLDSYLPSATYGATTISTEPDVVEWYGHWPEFFHGSYHIWNAGTDIQPFNTDISIDITQPPLSLSSTALSSAFHNYGILVSKNFVRYYIDDKQYIFYQRHAWNNVPMGFLIDLAGGGAGGGNALVNGSGPKYAYVTNFSYSPYIG